MTNFGRYLSEISSLNPLEIDLHDLVMSKGQVAPEARIQDVFANAAGGKNLLIFDNLDALSENIIDPLSKWENTGLTRVFMRHAYKHELPLIAKIYNPKRKVPDFVQEGFSLDIKFNALTTKQCEQAYQKYFGAEPSASITFPDNLVPGDFSKVAQLKRKDLNGGPNSEQLMTMLQTQARFRLEEKIGMGYHTALN